MNVISYLERIGIAEEVTSNLEDLKRLQKQHLLNIPFENFDIHSNTEITLDANKIYHKLIHQNRGGFCYELNGLFYELLNKLGFEVKRISGRVYSDGNYGKEYDHLAIIVSIESKEYLVDVGFGEFSFHPLKIELDTALEDERGIYKFDKYEQEYYRINKLVNGEMKPEYIFKNKERPIEAFDKMCRYHQTSKYSHFSKKKFITIPIKDGRITLSDNQLKIRKGESIVESEVKEEELNEILIKYFKFRPRKKVNEMGFVDKNRKI